jgi:hypothetical protein
MPMMLPDLREIFVISGAREIERGFDPSVEAAQKKLGSKVKITYWVELPFADVAHRVANLPPHSAVFFIAYPGACHFFCACLRLNRTLI